jgi:thioredoxin-related protein
MLRVLVLLCGLLAVSLAAASVRDPAKFFFEETFGNYQEELDNARQDGKQGILLFFEMDDCPFCHRMKTTVLNQSQVQDYFRKHFRIFSVDIEGDVEITDFQGRHTSQKDFAFKQYQVRATPVFAFFDLDGRLIARHTGPTSGVEEFLWLGEYVTGAHYRTESFTRFKRDKRQQALGK